MADDPKPVPVRLSKRCPECNGVLLLRQGRHGKFVSCINFPGCKYTEPDPADLVGRDCPECGHALVYRSGSNGRFISCSNFPKCKHTEPYMEKIGVKCPECGGEMVERYSRKNEKVFYGCDQYPACKFTSDFLPLDAPCPNCGERYMVLVGDDRAHCRKCQSDFTRKPAEDSGSGQS